MPLVDTVREGYAAYNRRDLGFVDEIFAEDIEFNVPGQTAHGRQGVKELFGGLAEQFSGHEITLVDSVEQGDRVVCFVRHHFTRPDGAEAQFDAVHDWHFGNGEVTKMNEVADTLAFAQIAGMVPA